MTPTIQADWANSVNCLLFDIQSLSVYFTVFTMNIGHLNSIVAEIKNKLCLCEIN